MSVFRRVDKKSDSLAGGNNVAGIGRYRIRYVEKLKVSLLHLIGVEFSWCRKPHANDNPAVLCDSVVLGARHGEGIVCTVVIFVPVTWTHPGGPRIATLV